MVCTVTGYFCHFCSIWGLGAAVWNCMLSDPWFCLPTIASHCWQPKSEDLNTYQRYSYASLRLGTTIHCTRAWRAWNTNFGSWWPRWVQVQKMVAGTGSTLDLWEKTKGTSQVYLIVRHDLVVGILAVEHLLKTHRVRHADRTYPPHDLSLIHISEPTRPY